jgi:hypothetical protein
MSEKLTKLHLEVKKTLRHMALTIGPLETDMQRAAQELVKEQTKKGQSIQYWRRITIRSFCGYIEAMLYQMKLCTLKVAPVAAKQFSNDELEILTELRTVLVPGQPPRTRPKFLPIPDNLKNTFHLFARIHGVEFHVDTTRTGWEDFQHLIEVRNRVTHPKGIYDVEVNDTSQERCERASVWLTEEYAKLMRTCGAKLPDIAAGARARFRR